MTHHDPRHEARRVALATLFERSFHSIDQDSSIARVLEVYEEKDVGQELLKLLLNGVTENAETLDKIIGETAPAWPPDQITKVDLITLRIAIFELVVAKNVPPKVAIDEAIELAKEFGGASSGSFVNGVLGTVVTQYLGGGEEASAADATEEAKEQRPQSEALQPKAVPEEGEETEGKQGSRGDQGSGELI